MVSPLGMLWRRAVALGLIPRPHFGPEAAAPTDRGWGRVARVEDQAPMDAAAPGAGPMPAAATVPAAGPPARTLKLPPWLAVLRLHQWVKSAFVAAPLFFTPWALSWRNLAIVALAMMCFCCAASAVYIINDLADRKADRGHPIKSLRPLAAGTLSLRSACAMMLTLAVVALTGAFALAVPFGFIVLAYLVMNLLYSLALKHVAILDVMLITTGFVLRVQGGAVVIGIEPSVWITLMTGLLAMFLALAKRRDDLTRSLGSAHRRSLDGYTVAFLDAAQTVVASALLVGYLIYVTSPDVEARLYTDDLFYTAPFVLFGILRYLQITTVENRSGAPITVLFTDWPMLVAVTGWLVTFAVLIH